MKQTLRQHNALIMIDQKNAHPSPNCVLPVDEKADQYEITLSFEKLPVLCAILTGLCIGAVTTALYLTA